MHHDQIQRQRYSSSSHDITTTTTTTTTKGRMPAGIVKKERQRRRSTMSENSKQKAFAAVFAANFLSDMYSGQHKFTSASTPWYSKQYHYHHSKFPIASVPSHDEMSERRSLDECKPCSFRTKLLEEIEEDSSDEFPTPSSTYDDLSVGYDVKFDDVDCVSVNRSTNMRGAYVQQRITTIPADLIGPDREESSGPQDSQMIEPISFPAGFSLQSTSTKQATEGVVATAQRISDYNISDEDLSEQVTMPFSVNSCREVRYRSSLLSYHAADNEDETLSDEDGIIIDDDMSIITDISLIPTYSPSDVMRQQQNIRAHTLFARLIKAKTNAAKQTVRQLKRSCRGVVEGKFSDSRNSYTPTKCVGVGETF
ncbi:hypothetical protein QBC38DRAFT_462579 [Podospora fimiseda]|uniref:Uncharacterized protein n=1 Tax=Podospora fimiseda TaxID=252190 RepID=A0AAN6YL96_9PEZI|nr:hypothetical protein QBC38DRAFT_462579 [Podospora fimiseda]